MKVMLDTCVWGGVLPDLRTAGHDVVWTGEWDEDPGDDEILARAHAEEWVVITHELKVLEIYDTIATAVEAGPPGQTLLVSPPSRPRECLPDWQPGKPKAAN